MHKLWYVLYKERNLLLTEREKLRRTNKHTAVLEENRYRNVKRSMANIKFVLTERDTVEKLVQDQRTVDLQNPAEVQEVVSELAAGVSRYSAVTLAEEVKAAAKAAARENKAAKTAE